MSFNDLWQLLGGSGLLGLVSLLTWYTTNRGTKRANETDNLKAASDAWRELGDDLREEVSELRGDVEALRDDNQRLRDENARVRGVLADMRRWLAEFAAWEAHGAKPPPPYTWQQLEARLKTISITGEKQ
ncbi:hypothetical protein [Dermabacter vaginalis]|uniref:Uncharacterized protein n=1 Tax=Dermabacter vaginalis TaxID=1630135 RepID=A0ABX6A396_9MICO|nr:hypothetical protein [Dermabacter vaginalis]QEU11661.1 hypothetical protein FOB48_04685 [Dermabacter vaginalis]